MQFISWSISDHWTGSSQRCAMKYTVVIPFFVPPCQPLRAGPRVSFHTPRETRPLTASTARAWHGFSRKFNLSHLHVVHLSLSCLLNHCLFSVSYLVLSQSIVSAPFPSSPGTVNKVKQCFPEALEAISFSIIIWGYYRGKYDFVLLPRDHVDVLFLTLQK